MSTQTKQADELRIQSKAHALALAVIGYALAKVKRPVRYDRNLLTYHDFLYIKQLLETPDDQVVVEFISQHNEVLEFCKKYDCFIEYAAITGYVKLYVNSSREQL